MHWYIKDRNKPAGYYFKGFTGPFSTYSGRRTEATVFRTKAETMRFIRERSLRGAFPAREPDEA
jgi:hypothetical protein